MYTKIKRLHILKILLIVPISLSILLASGCTSTSDRSKKPDGDWSRGLLLGESNIKRAVTLTVDGEGHVHVAWQERVGEEERIHYTHLNQQGQVVVDEVLSIDLPILRWPQLLVDEDDRPHLALISRSDGQQRLYHALLDPGGQVQDLARVSREGEDVTSFQMYLSGEENVAFVWSSEPEGEQAGVYRLVLDEASEPTLLVPDGIEPFVLVDDARTTHLTWLIQTGFSARDIYYATLEGTAVRPSGGQRLSAFEFAESATYHGPVIGLDTENVYVLWSIQNLGGGLTPTEAFAYYVSFPSGGARFLAPRNVKIPTEPRPDYDDHASPYTYSELRPFPASFYGTDFVNAPSAVRGQESELPAAVSLIVESASKSSMQLAMVVFSDGEPVGYQLANRTTNASIAPTLMADDEANLHLAWLDTAGFRRYRVYYATTAPQAKAWLDRTTAGDVGRGAADLVWGVLSAIGFLPLAAMWNAPPLIWLVLFYLFAREEVLDQLSAKIALGVAFVLYITIKTLFLPGLLATGTPLIYQVPDQIVPLLTTALPIVILLLGLAATFVYVRRATQEPSLFKAYLVFAITDGLLTAALYAPRFFNPQG